MQKAKFWTDIHVRGDGKMRSPMTYLTSAVFAVACGLTLNVVTGPAQAGKPIDLGQIDVVLAGDFIADAAGANNSGNGTFASTKKTSSVEVVVRGVLVDFLPDFQIQFDEGDTCFQVIEPKAGSFDLAGNDSAVFTYFPVLQDKNGDEQLYQIELFGTIDPGDHIDDLVDGDGMVTVTFTVADVQTGGRGARKRSCTGSANIDPTTATFMSN